MSFHGPMIFSALLCYPILYGHINTSFYQKVPWKSLGKEPVIVLIDRVFILAHPASDGRTLKV